MDEFTTPKSLKRPKSQLKSFEYQQIPNMPRYIDQLPDPNPILPYDCFNQEIKSAIPLKRSINLLDQQIQQQEIQKYEKLYFDCISENFKIQSIPKQMTLFEHHQHFINNCVYMRHQLPNNRLYFATLMISLNQQLKPNIISEQSFPNQQKNSLIFDSLFESGNLFASYKVTETLYNLVLQNDINTKGYTQWFFFSVQNTIPGTEYRFNIINLAKSSSLFQKGMKPVVYSSRSRRWLRGGFNIQYYENDIIKSSEVDQRYYTLSFSYIFEEDSDIVYFAYAYPYGLSDLNRFLSEVVQNSTHVKCRQLCRTIAGNVCPFLTITSQQKEITDDRQGVLIMARQHAGEITGSFLMEGIIQYLIDNSFEAQYLRKHFVFKLIPMMNPDGVIHGNYRCSLSGTDMNRNWQDPKVKLYPANVAVIQLVEQLMKERQIKLVLDLHSHSKKQETFFYGNVDRQIEGDTRAFPSLISQYSDFISFKNSRFSVTAQQHKTARVALWRKLFYNPNVFTLESSFFGYQRDDKIIHYTTDNLRQIGRDICKTIFLHKYNNQISKSLYPTLEISFRSSQQENISEYKSKKLNTNEEYDNVTSGSDSNPSEDALSQKCYFVAQKRTNQRTKITMHLNNRNRFDFSFNKQLLNKQYLDNSYMKNKSERQNRSLSVTTTSNQYISQVYALQTSKHIIFPKKKYLNFQKRNTWTQTPQCQKSNFISIQEQSEFKLKVTSDKINENNYKNLSKATQTQMTVFSQDQPVVRRLFQQKDSYQKSSKEKEQSNLNVLNLGLSINKNSYRKAGVSKDIQNQRLKFQFCSNSKKNTLSTLERDRERLNQKQWCRATDQILKDSSNIQSDYKVLENKEMKYKYYSSDYFGKKVSNKIKRKSFRDENQTPYTTDKGNSLSINPCHYSFDRFQ